MQLHIFKDLHELSQSLADWIISDIQKTLETKDRYTLVLSGGGTPKALYKLLAALPRRDQIDWKKIHFFLGDERYVPFEDDRNNGKMAYETLLDHVPVLKDHVHLMNTTLAPEAAAREYEKLLHTYFEKEPVTFDLVLLGMGDDGHTLSLFPGTEVVHEETAWVAAPFIKAQDMYRITLTRAIVNRSKAIVFLAAGAQKAAALKEVIEGAFNPDLYPSQVIRPKNDHLYWYVDEAAAAQLKEK